MIKLGKHILLKSTVMSLYQPDKETAHFGKNNDLPTELTDHYPRISNSNHWLVTLRQWESVAVFTANDEDLQTLEKTTTACWLLQHSNRFWGWWHPLVSLSAGSSNQLIMQVLQMNAGLVKHCIRLQIVCSEWCCTLCPSKLFVFGSLTTHFHFPVCFTFVYQFLLCSGHYQWLTLHLIS